MDQDAEEEQSKAPASSKSLKLVEIHPILDKALHSLMAEWPVEPGKVSGKREQLQLLLKEVGIMRFRQAVQRTIETHPGGFFPTIAIIRGNVPSLDKAPLCGKCQSGWVIACYGKDSLPRMRRCDCRGGREADRRISEGEWRPPE